MRKSNTKSLELLIIILAYLLISTLSFAQSPQKMSYQAVIRNGSNSLVVSATIGMKISILQTSPTGKVVYSETQMPSTNSNGLVSIEFGGQKGFDAIDWSNGPYFLLTETDPSGGTNYSITGTSQLLSVPYAIHAATADSVKSGITESDPIFSASVASAITAQDTANWNHKLSHEMDSSTTNELQTLSISNDTIFLSNGGFVRLPAVTSSSFLPPTATVDSALEVRSYSAILNGTVNANGFSTTVVFDWGPTTAYDSSATQTQGLVTGTSNVQKVAYLWGLQSATTYHYRVKATNAVNTTYSNDMTFTTLNSPPQLTTKAIFPSSNATTSCGGIITHTGGLPITSRGVCWSTIAHPTIANDLTSDGTGSGSFTSSIPGLVMGTVYFVRAYAANSEGTSYGNEFSFIAGIGSTYQGGRIAYILQSGDPGYNPSQLHGLIAAPSDQSSGAEWGCVGAIITGADGTAIGTGNQNTIDIMAGCSTAGIAARLCGDLVLGGYSDWYLPSKDELNKLYLNKVAVGGFSDNTYWSSSKYGPTFCTYQSFRDGMQSNSGRANSFSVRAIRAF